MDVNSHLFPEGNREWVAKHDKPANPSVSRAESATSCNLKKWSKCGVLRGGFVWWRWSGLNLILAHRAHPPA